MKTFIDDNNRCFSMNIKSHHFNLQQTKTFQNINNF
jgi:hypothetical protein